MASPAKILSDAKCVVWDFDGVIKESVSVKTQAFYDLFLPFGEDVASKVRAHHLENTGVSRHKKLELYLDWAGLDVSTHVISEFADRFADKVVSSVINSGWTRGVLHYLSQNWRKKKFIICSATPQDELQYICEQINISHMFLALVGTPQSKSDGIQAFLSENPSLLTSTVMIGDATADIEAARASKIKFILRCHSENTDLSDTWQGPKIKDFQGLV